ncbi:MAG: hypothetical protein NT066_05065 [Candidatus Omnitrophica bacterium]|nr:hypothetical protein [Candidatus Omnitrophota bacterium]
MRLTTSKYFTPSGKVIHGKGVMPDIVVEEGKIELAKPDEIKTEKPQDIFEEIEKKEKVVKDQKPMDYKSDNQLIRAVDILKALKFYRDAKK